MRDIMGVPTSKAQCRKRLQEAERKIFLVYMAHNTGTYGLTTNDQKKLIDTCEFLRKCIMKMK